MKYLDAGQRIAVEHLAKAVEAFVLINDLDPKSGRDMKEMAKAVRLWTEVREYGKAAQIARGLRTVIAIHVEDVDGVTETVRVLDRSIRTLSKESASNHEEKP